MRTRDETASCALVTNDDGPRAPGLAALVRAAADAGRDVVVAVPAHDVSSTGTATGALDATPVVCWPSRDPWPEAVAAFEVAAFPPAIVDVALMGAFGPTPGLVLAGVNHGLNVGRGLIHSSTIGSVLAAAVRDVPAVAISAERGADWAQWRPALARLVGALPSAWPRGIALSVNLPREPPADDTDPVWCQPADVTATVRLVRTPMDGGRVAMHVSYRPQLPARGGRTDASVVSSGRIALTSVSLSYSGPVSPSWREELSVQMRPSEAGAA